VTAASPTTGSFPPRLPSLHHSLWDLSPVARTKLSGSPVHLRGTTSITHGCISVTDEAYLLSRLDLPLLRRNDTSGRPAVADVKHSSPRFRLGIYPCGSNHRPRGTSRSTSVGFIVYVITRFMKRFQKRVWRARIHNMSPFKRFSRVQSTSGQFCTAVSGGSPSWQ